MKLKMRLFTCFTSSPVYDKIADFDPFLEVSKVKTEEAAKKAVDDCEDTLPVLTPKHKSNHLPTDGQRGR
ncbi:hypothetical protein RJ55_08634 [Drechmeria coniospora]|nr:hypothetical protein RJ55_08634 [Drechmeria coniospora]